MSRFQNLRILVCGEVCIDRYVSVTNAKQSPEADVPIVTEGMDMAQELLGMSANVWNNLRALGVDAHLQTVIGHRWPDLFSGKNFSVTVDGSRQTATKTRLLVDGQHVCRYDQEDVHPLSRDAETDFLNALITKIRFGTFHAVILQDYGKGLWTEYTLTFLDYCKEKKIPVFVDPYEGRPISDYDGAFVVKPNRIEANEMLLAKTPVWNNWEAFSDDEVLGALRSRSGADWVVLTAGANGMLAEGQGGVYKASPEGTEMIDPTGAGDTALAVLTCMMLSEYDIQTSMEAANKAAGLVIKRLGVGTIREEDIKEFLEVH